MPCIVVIYELVLSLQQFYKLTKVNTLQFIFISLHHLAELFAHNKQSVVAECIYHSLLSVDAMVYI